MSKILGILALGVASSMTLPAAAQSNSHLDQPVRRHVNLVLQFDGTSPCPNQRSFFERFASGTVSSEPFRVPGTELLVITDITWEAVEQPAGFYAKGGVITAQVESRFGSQLPRQVHRTSSINLTPDYDDMTRIGGTDSPKAGVTVGSARTLCIRASSNTNTTFAAHEVVSASIQGYLTDK